MVFPSWLSGVPHCRHIPTCDDDSLAILLHHTRPWAHTSRPVSQGSQPQRRVPNPASRVEFPSLRPPTVPNAQQPTPQSAADPALHIPEILELILAELPATDLRRAAKLVCRFWHNNVLFSKTIRSASVLQPWVPTDRHLVWQMNRDRTNGNQWTHLAQYQAPDRIALHPQLAARVSKVMNKRIFPTLHLRGPTYHFKRGGPYMPEDYQALSTFESCKDHFATHPPVQVIGMRVHARAGILVRVDEGVRIRDLVAAARNLLRQDGHMNDARVPTRMQIYCEIAW
jgi:hypothetical protein